ncbi:MAG: four helix bundle protein [Bacteroidota bacterium]|nr:four helix bundle protein [Bacteroidota bacterium]
MLYFNFQKLEIYQLSKELVKDIYKLSSSFPSDEKYALVQQTNRAAVSVASDITEGTSSNGCQEKIHVINI